MSNKDEIKEINAKLREISKEFNSLSALKKELVNEGKVNDYAEKFGDYKYLVKNTFNDNFDLKKLLDENELQIVKSRYGLLCANYEVGDGTRAYHLARTEEEATQIRVVEAIFKVGDEISELIKGKDPLTAQQILELYDEARIERKLAELSEEETVSE